MKKLLIVLILIGTLIFARPVAAASTIVQTFIVPISYQDTYEDGSSDTYTGVHVLRQVRTPGAADVLTDSLTLTIVSADASGATTGTTVNNTSSKSVTLSGYQLLNRVRTEASLLNPDGTAVTYVTQYVLMNGTYIVEQDWLNGKLVYHLP